jgi:tRNA(fMet)-specific endonuclease VapC
MRRFVLDTNVLLAYYRAHPIYNIIESENTLREQDVVLIMPIAVKAEILSIALQYNWGEKKYKLIKKIVEQSFIVHTNDEIADAYVEIDAYSQNNLKSKPMGMSPRNMGKNDFWIAATARVANAVLITTDADFDHLNGIYLDVKKYPVKK